MKRNLISAGISLVLAAAVAAVPAYAGESEQGGLSLFGNIGEESSQIIAPQSVVPDNSSVVALDDLGFSVAPGEFTSIRQEDGFVYIYTMEDGSMPYVILGRYESGADGLEFADAFTAYMQGVYADLQVTEPANSIVIAGNPCARIAYQYAVSGYTVRDTRLFLAAGGYTCMFGAKEVPALNYFLPEGYLEQVAASFSMLAGGWDDYPNHVDSTHELEGGLSLSQLGGMGTDTAGTDVPEPGSEGGTEGGTIGSAGTGIGPVGGTGGDALDGSITFSESVADFEGTWVPFDDGFKLYLPNDWVWYNLTDEQKAANVIYLAGSNSGAADAPFVSVAWTQSNGLQTLSDVAQELSNSGFRVDGKASINGIPAVTYASEEQNISGVMFFHPRSTEYLFAVVAENFSSNVDTEAAILCSLSPNG